MKVSDREFTGLQLCYDTKADVVCLRWGLGDKAKADPPRAAALVLTVVPRCSGYQARSERLSGLGRRAGVSGLIICDPGGLLHRAGDDALTILVHATVDRCWSDADVLREMIGSLE